MTDIREPDPAEEGAYDAADFQDKPTSTPEENDAGEDKEGMLAWWLEAEAKWKGSHDVNEEVPA